MRLNKVSFFVLFLIEKALPQINYSKRLLKCIGYCLTTSIMTKTSVLFIIWTHILLVQLKWFMENRNTASANQFVVIGCKDIFQRQILVKKNQGQFAEYGFKSGIRMSSHFNIFKILEVVIEPLIFKYKDKRYRSAKLIFLRKKGQIKHTRREKTMPRKEKEKRRNLFLRGKIDQ